MNPQHKAAGRRFESDLVGDSSTAAAGNSLVEAQTIAYRLQQASGYTPGDGDECVQVFIHDLPARTGQGALAWQPRARPKMGAGARSALGVPKSTRVKLLGVPAHFNEAVPPRRTPRIVLPGTCSKCARAWNQRTIRSWRFWSCTRNTGPNADQFARGQRRCLAPRTKFQSPLFTLDNIAI